MRRRLLGKLQRHLDSCKHKRMTVEQIVAHLRSVDNEYARMNLQQFTKIVRQTLACSPNRKRKRDTQNPSGEEELNRISSSKKTIENVHPRRSSRYQNTMNKSNVSSDTSLYNESEDSGGDGEETTIGTSEDAKAPYDLTKLGLRETYTEVNSTRISAKLVREKNFEFKTERKTGVGIGTCLESKRLNLSSNNAPSGHALSVNRRERRRRFRDLGGMKELLADLWNGVIMPIYHPVLSGTLGVRPLTGILLTGPSGCGKTSLAQAIANESGLPFYPITGGSSEENIRELFQKAYRTAPSIVFIDEIDAIASKRENLQKGTELRIVAQLLTCMDECHIQVQATGEEAELQNSQINQGSVLVIAATNRPDALDPRLRRPGRFDREILLGVPDENTRAEILLVLTKDAKLEGPIDHMKIARMTPGYVATDLDGLICEAASLANRRIVDHRISSISIDLDEGDAEKWWQHPWMPEDLENHSISMADIEEALKTFQPSSRREGFSTIPDVTWEDVGGLDSLKKEFEGYIIQCIKCPKSYEHYHGQPKRERGILLFGPPGSGKTHIAQAVANKAGANFIYIKGPELLNKYVGESELAVRKLFSRARTCSPCIIFFDEIDAIASQRETEGGRVGVRLVDQLLSELNGPDHNRGVFVIGATNRIDVIDIALLRSGRLGKLFYVGLPIEDERELILKACSRKKPIDPDVDLHAIARMEACEYLSAADLSELVSEAASVAWKEYLRSSGDSDGGSLGMIKTMHFEQALAKIRPSVKKEDVIKLEKLADVYGCEFIGRRISKAFVVTDAAFT